MNSVKRGGGRPNRGGGRANRSRGRGQSYVAPPQNPKGNLSRKVDLFDNDDLVDYEDQEDASDDDDFEYAEDDSVASEKQATKPPERRKVEIHVLHMSQDAQDLVQKTLTELRGGSFKLIDENQCKDSGQSLHRRFWVRDRHLLVRGVDKSNSALSEVTGIKTDDLDSVNAFAFKKCSSLGFHPSRCVRALKEADGDVGKAIELLMSDAFNLGLRLSSEEVAPETNEELFSTLNDEKSALESIYGESFIEKLPYKSWELKFFLPHLLKYLPKDSSHSTIKKEISNQVKNICQFYANGYCKFGIRCRLRHVQPEQVKVVDDRHLRAKPEEMFFNLEIRFPEGSRYPNEPPLVYFSTPIKDFSGHLCLKITYRLMEEARLLAEDSLPSIFALISLIENQSEMDSVLSGPDVPFSFDEALLPSSSHPNKKSSANNEAELGSKDQNSNEKTRDTASHSRVRKCSTKIREENETLRKRFMQKQDQLEYQRMQKQRQELPAWNERGKVLEALRNSQVVVVSGMTGCGKSTQVPQFILDDWLRNENSEHCNIVCTQPRRISAIGVAERVADERVEKIGNVVGYQIRLESKTSSQTRLLFCTTGILLRRLESDSDLDGVSHIIVDEVHERSEESDFLLLILRDLLRRNKKLRIILMSATLNAKLFSKYFGSIPVLDIPGRTFPVEQFFLEDILETTGYSVEPGSSYAKRLQNSKIDREVVKGNNRDFFIDSHDYEMLIQQKDATSVRPAKDTTPDEKLSPKQIHIRYSDCSDKTRRTLSMMDFEKIDFDLIERTLLHIVENFPPEGSILVFLPGMQEIMTAFDQIANHPILGTKAGKFKIVPLHSSLSSEQQAAVFEKPRAGIRKIVLSTNLAETSITIDDCVFVIEVGRMKEKRFDPMKNMESLETVWVSRANALQRKGRAGRVRSGFCFHLYTSFRFETHFRADPVPEILRVPLEQMLLRIKILPLFSEMNLYEVLRKMIEPPNTEAVDGAVKRLKDVGAMFAEESNLELTPLGFHLSRLPVDVRIGKLMLFGAIFKCLDSALTMAACLSYRSPFVSPFGDRREDARKKKMEFSARNSDHLTMLRAYQGWHNASMKSQYAGYVFSQENFLSQKTLQTLAVMKHQFLELLSSIGFVGEEISCRKLDRLARNGCGDAVAKASNQDLHRNNQNYKLLSAVLCAALYPNIVQILTPDLKYKQTAAGAMLKAPSSEDLKFKTKEDGYVFVHPSSVIYNCGYFENPYLVYHEKIKTSRVFLREVTMVPVYPMVLFGGTGVDVIRQGGRHVLTMESGWIKFVCASFAVAQYLKEMRIELDKLLEEKITQPTLDLVSYPRGKLIIDSIVKLISTE